VTVALVPVTLPGRAHRVNITMDEGLLHEIDAVADNRSRFLADAARAELARRRAGE
jgi:metal-responsive CopG/Arc/MetJ family transcriptional regulator